MRIDFPKTAYLLFIFSLIYYLPAYCDWSPPVRISQAGDCWDPQIIASGDTLHVVYENTGERYDKVSYVRSTDAGQSWSPPIRLTERRGNTLFPRIIQNGQHLMALWKQEFNTGYYIYNIGYAISSNGGASWDSAQYVFDQNWMGMQNMAAAGAGPNVEVIVGAQVAYDFIYYSLHSTNFGISWSVSQEMFPCYQSEAPDCDASEGLLGFVWDGRFDADHSIEIYYTGSSDGGENWSGNFALSDTDGYHSQIPAIDINDSDSVAVCWMDFKYAPQGSATGDIFLRQSSDSGTNWNQINELFCNHKAFKSDLVANGDTIHIVWEDESHGMFHATVKYVRSNDGGITWSEPLWLDSTIYHNSRSPALAVSDGRVYAVWNGYRAMPDSSALYFSYSPYEPDDVGNSGNVNLPIEIELSAYPNPFNSSTIISFSDLEGDEIRIFDIKGSLVRILKPEQKMNGSIIWDATDNGGQRVSSGIYFAGATSQENSKTIKLIYLK